MNHRDTPPNHVVAMPGTLVDPAVFDHVELPTGWQWHPVDWMNEPPPWDLRTNSRRLAAAARKAEGGLLVLLGHSSGGAACLLTMLNEEPGVDGLVLIDTGANTRGHGDPGLPERVLSQWSPEFRKEYLRTCVATEPDPQTWDRMVEFAASVPKEAMAQAAASLRSIDLTDQLDRIAVPTLVVQGRYDQRRSLSHATDLARRIPRSQLVELSAGHTPMLDAPEELSGVLAAFLASMTPKDVEL